MINATKRQKKIKLPLEQAVKFHLIVELTFFRKETLIPSDLELLTHLALVGEVSLPAFCTQVARKLHPDCPPEQLATREQNVRNRVVKLEKRGLLVKSRPASVTLITLSADLAIPVDLPILLDYQLLGLASAQV